MPLTALLSNLGNRAAAMPDEVHAAFRNLALFRGAGEDFVETMRLATEMAAPFSPQREAELVNRWVASPPAHARYCFLADT